MFLLTRLLCVSGIYCCILSGDTLYVTNENSNAPAGASSYVSAYNLETKAFLGNLGPTVAYALPDAITVVAPFGNIYVADAGADRVVEFNSSFHQIAVYNTQPLTYSQVSPSGLAVDSAGNVYVANLDGSIQKISGGVVSTIGTVNGIARGIAYDPYNGLLYITSQAPGDIYTMSTTGGAATLFASNIGSGNLRGLAFGNGNLYVSDTDYNHVGQIYEFVANSNVPVLFAPNQTGPNYIAVDSLGNLYVAEYYGNDVEKIAAAGVDLGPYIAGLAGPSGIAIGPDVMPAPEPADFALTAFALLLPASFYQLRRVRKAKGT
jgi:sugar lactone lactonase YvrE